MASSSVHKTFKYDVFLSFRGEDTRRTFVDHLYDALDRQGIHTFKDDKRLEKGKRINDELLESIQDSRLYIIVFSKNYASSSWCLNELLKIMECQKKKEQTAYPVFYDVEPAEVRKQSGSVGEALSIHKNESEVGIWCEALKEAANLSGWEVRKTADGCEARVIRLIVEKVSRELCSVNVKWNCGFHARNGLRVLQTKSLITIEGGHETTEYEYYLRDESQRYEQIRMHDHIEEMGKNIVCRLHPDDPSRHSRLWVQEEIKDVLACDIGTEETRCICMEVTPDIDLAGVYLLLSNSLRSISGWFVDPSCVDCHSAKMSRHISTVLDINPGTKKSWTVLVQVIEDGHEQVSQSGRRYRRLVLSDSEGTKFNAVIYESHLRFLACLLLQYRRYYISNAVVYENDARYHISEYQYYWVINNRTLIEELVESIPTTLACQFEFTRFNDLYKYADAEYPLNVKAIVLHCFPSREAGLENKTRRDVVIVNEEKKLLLLTLWDQFDQKDGTTLAGLVGSGPIIFGMRLRVTTFNSLSLTTKASSCLLINPPEDESNKLKDWYNENKQELQELLQLKSYKNTDLLLPYPKEEDIMTIAKAASLLNTPAWVKGKASFPTQQRSLWYTACANCQKGLEADLSWVVTCPSCKVETNVQPISRLTIVIDDGTKNIRATICTPDAEILMPFTAIQLKEADEFGLDCHEEISDSVQQQTIIAYIRSYKATFQGQPQVNTIVVKCYKAHEALSLPNISSQHGEQSSKSTTNTGSQLTIDKEQPTKAATTTGSEERIDKAKSQVSIPKTPLKQAKRSVPVPASTPLPLHIKKEAGISSQETDGSATKKMKETSK